MTPLFSWSPSVYELKFFGENTGSKLRQPRGVFIKKKPNPSPIFSSTRAATCSQEFACPCLQRVMFFRAREVSETNLLVSIINTSSMSNVQHIVICCLQAFGELNFAKSWTACLIVWNLILNPPLKIECTGIEIKMFHV